MAEKITAVKREQSGSGAARRMRRAGRLPAVIYNNKGEARSIELKQHDFEQMLHHHTSENLIVDVEVDGVLQGKALLKDVQHDQISGSVLHVDLVEISMTETLRVSIAIEPVGDAKGVELGGTLEHNLREIEVECLPDAIVEQFEVDVSGLLIGDSILVRELTLGPQYEILTPGELTVVSVAEPRLEEEPVESEEGEAAEPELIRKAAEDEDEEAGDAKGEKTGGK